MVNALGLAHKKMQKDLWLSNFSLMAAVFGLKKRHGTNMEYLRTESLNVGRVLRCLKKSVFGIITDYVSKT